ncbi:MAG: (d)CMP kinase, partial [Chloroflexota bacterium]
GDGRFCDVTVSARDVTWAIREPSVDANVSLVASHPRVRAALLPVQRRIVARGHVVIVGRDIGTVVAPEAPLKVYLQASLDIRAKRRWRDLIAQGHPEADLTQVRADLERRDNFDSRRATAPLAIAADAILVENDQVTITELVELLANLAMGEVKGGGA